MQVQRGLWPLGRAARVQAGTQWFVPDVSALHKLLYASFSEGTVGHEGKGSLGYILTKSPNLPLIFILSKNGKTLVYNQKHYSEILKKTKLPHHSFK